MPLFLTAGAFHPPVDLHAWQIALQSDSRWKLIHRNFDRECDRGEIDPTVWEQFLRDIESEWKARSPRAGLVSPVNAIDKVMRRNWKVFTPPGSTLNEPPEATLYRYMRLDHFWQYNLTHLPISGQSNKLARVINSGRITGADITGDVGAADRPGWCTNDASAAKFTIANRIRNLIGLKHIEGDWLLELAFPVSFLYSQNIALQAPTVIDSVAGGAENWIFSKRKPPGGPEWGITVDMENGGACGPGVSEAVHKQFNGAPQRGLWIQLRAVGEITASAPSVDYGRLLGNSLI